MEKVLNYYKKWGIFVLLIIEILVFAVISPDFMSVSNLLNVLRQVAMLGIVSIGVTFVIIGGGMDLSVGGQMAVGGILCALLMTKMGCPMVMAILFEIVFGILCGIINGVLAVKLKVMSMIITLGTMTSLQGLAQVLTNGYPVFGFTSDFKIIGQGYLGPIPIPVIILAITIIAASFILNKTYFGRHIVALGSNEEAARLAGVNTNKMKIINFALCGFFTSIASIIMLSRTNSAQPAAGGTYAFDCMTAVVLGGVSITGGRGKVTGALAGVVFIGVLNNALILMGINEYWKEVLKGIILIAAVALDHIEVKTKRPVIQE